MKDVYKTEKEVKGIKIKNLTIGFLIFAIIVFLTILVASSKIVGQYEKHQKTTETYVMIHHDIMALEDENSFRTNVARKCVITMETDLMYQYSGRVQERSAGYVLLADIRRNCTDIDEEIYEEVEDIIHGINVLQALELRSMRMVAEIAGCTEDEIPEIIREVELSESEKNYTEQEFRDHAYYLVFDNIYSGYQEDIDEKLENVRQEITEYVQEKQKQSEVELKESIRNELIGSCMLFALLILTVLGLMFLVVRPMQNFASCIRDEKLLDMTALQEFNLLAGTYNEFFSRNAASKLELNKQANFDALTGILNRGSFERLSEFLSGSLYPVALLMLDVDVFKSINDNYGHEVGDMALKKLAGLLTAHFRSVDYPIRYGGDEFLVIMTDVTPDRKDMIRGKIKEINEILLHPDDGLPAFSISVGIAFSQKGYNEELFRRADKALYYTKEHGRCGFTFYQKDICE